MCVKRDPAPWGKLCDSLVPTCGHVCPPPATIDFFLMPFFILTAPFGACCC